MVARLMLLGMFMPILGMACDPVSDLKNIGIRLKTLPQVIEEPNNKWPGDYTFGIVHVRSLLDCETLVHEMVHAYQDQRDGGPAKDYNEWWRREMEANALAKRATRESQ